MSIFSDRLAALSEKARRLLSGSHSGWDTTITLMQYRERDGKHSCRVITEFQTKFYNGMTPHEMTSLLSELDSLEHLSQKASRLSTRLTQVRYQTTSSLQWFEGSFQAMGDLTIIGGTKQDLRDAALALFVRELKAKVIARL